MAMAEESALYRFSLRPPTRYTATAQALHWLTALLIFTIIPVAWHMESMARDNPARETWYTVHKSLGLTILAITVIRIVWRGMHPAPPLPGTMATLEAAAATASHWLLYLILFLMPISGYLISAAGGHPVNYFGLFEIPNIVPQSKQVAGIADQVHVTTQWAVYALVVLHILGTAYHLIVRRDAILDRMLPAQDHTAL